MQLALLAGVLLAVAWGLCAVATSGPSADPVWMAEVVGGLALGVWAVLAGSTLVRDALAGRALGRQAVPTDVLGVPVSVLVDGGTHAFVLGALRPRIYLGAGLLAQLDRDEIRAVLRHEQHHQRTRAPLRAAALNAWRVLLAPFGAGRTAIDTRLADLEIEADRAALAGGSTASAIASALLKCDDAGLAGANFTSAAARRIRWLVGRDSAAPGAWHPALPYEWIPAAGFALFVVACHGSLGPLR